MHVKWPKIENFHSVRRTLKDAPEFLGGIPKVLYRAKIKLHGTNAGIRLCPDGQVIPLSRDRVISPGKADNSGFARWVSETPMWEQRCKWGRDIVVFGEWCGPKIQNGMALNKIPQNIFAVFAVIDLTHGGNGELIVEPSEIAAIIGEIPQTHILPWFSEETVDLDWSLGAEELEVVLAPLNAQVLAVEACDPWVEKVFGIKGMGEGLVFYPISHAGHEGFTNLAFKAKGLEHRTVKAAQALQPNPEVAAQAPAFAELVVTVARLEQGIREVNGGELVFDMKNLGAFLKWLTVDIAKETKAELEASGLDPKAASAACIARAKAWFQEQIRTS